MSAAQCPGGEAPEDAARQRRRTPRHHLRRGRGNARTLRPRCAAFNPCLPPTCEKMSLKHVASWQSCTALLSRQPRPTGEGQKPLLPGERMFRDGSWMGVCSTRGCTAVDACPGSHQDHVNTLAYGEVMPNRDAAETPKCWCCCC